MTKYVYQVYGSEDGTMGIYSSYKRAMEAGKEYVFNSANPLYEVDKASEWITFVKGEYVQADIERFILE